MICKKKEKQIRTKCNEKREYPTKLTLDECEKIVPEVVVLHNDQEMMNSIAGVKSLMVYDFLKHESCHQKYVKIVRNAKDGPKVEDE